MSPIISPEELKKKMAESDVIIIDAQTGSNSFEQYKTQHIQGAHHVDVDTDLSEKSSDPAKGGRHPLPDVKKFSSLLGKLGITPTAYVIVYDNKQGALSAARFWWMLKAAGHHKVQVLDGGLNAAIDAGISLTSEIVNSSPVVPYPVQEWKLPTVSLNSVKEATTDSNYLIIDVRESYRYRGEKEPIDLVAGHIPSAINIPYLNNLDSEGFFLSPDKLAALYKAKIGDRKPNDVIVSCGSGITACHAILAMEQAGLSGANLYVGSWSEWSRNKLPIATGE